jgi:hypothetical protein
LTSVGAAGVLGVLGAESFIEILRMLNLAGMIHGTCGKGIGRCKEEETILSFLALQEFRELTPNHA